MDHDDDLISRLQGLGDKLDERREGSAHRHATVRQLRPRAGAQRRFAQAAVVLVIAALAVGAFFASQDQDQRVRTATTTAPAAVSVDELAADLRAQADRSVKECAAAEAAPTSSTSQPLPPDGEYTAVGIGPGCLKGWARTAGMSGDDLVPVYRAPGDPEVIGYWLAGVGWVTPEIANAPGFDPELLRAAADLANGVSSGPGG